MDPEGLSLYKSSFSITIPEDVTVPNTKIWAQTINHDPSNKPAMQDDDHRSSNYTSKEPRPALLSDGKPAKAKHCEMEVNSIVIINSQTFAPFVSNIIFGTGQGKRPPKFAINTPEAGDSGRRVQENQDWNQTNRANGLHYLFQLTVTLQSTLVQE
jgi:hypothetical protein